MSDLLNVLLQLEHAGWKSLCDGTASSFYATQMTEHGRMILVGGQVMARDEVVQTLQYAPPWADYRIEDPVLQLVSEKVAVLLYTGTAYREDGPALTAQMSSLYVRDQQLWRLALYTQTLLD